MVHLAVDGLYAGYLIISDELKEDALTAVHSLRKLGIKKIVMLTGDSEVVAKGVAERLGLDSYLAELLPEEKVVFVGWQNIGFALAIKAIFITLGIIGLATMWEAVFADVGVSLN